MVGKLSSVNVGNRVHACVCGSVREIKIIVFEVGGVAPCNLVDKYLCYFPEDGSEKLKLLW